MNVGWEDGPRVISSTCRTDMWDLGFIQHFWRLKLSGMWCRVLKWDFLTLLTQKVHSSLGSSGPRRTAMQKHRVYVSPRSGCRKYRMSCGVVWQCSDMQWDVSCKPFCTMTRHQTKAMSSAIHYHPSSFGSQTVCSSSRFVLHTQPFCMAILQGLFEVDEIFAQ
jgi:hypothetical protein